MSHLTGAFNAVGAEPAESAVTPQALPANLPEHFEHQRSAAHIIADEEYFVWGLTAMRWSDGKIHAYYSRWPKRIGFRGWQTHSEIVHAVADSPAGPFQTTGVVLSSRNPEGWDSINAHNPSVCVADGRIYLFYVGNRIGDYYKAKPGQPLPSDEWLFRHRRELHLSQRITVAVAEQPEGPFVRSPEPVLKPTGRFKDVAVNPAVVQHGDKFLMIAKGDDVRHEKPFRIQCAAIADRPDGLYRQVAQPAFDDFQTEDACIWHDRRLQVYRCVVHELFKDRLVELRSRDGRTWERGDPFTFTYKRFPLADGTEWKPDRAERPFVLADADGRPEWLYVAVKKGNASANLAIPLASADAE
jgi:hypothetical protein